MENLHLYWVEVLPKTKIEFYVGKNNSSKTCFQLSKLGFVLNV